MMVSLFSQSRKKILFWADKHSFKSKKMKNQTLIVLALLMTAACNSNHKQTTADKQADTALSKKSGAESMDQPQSQYVIESNTMVFYDRSIHDEFASRRFFKCVDVFSSEVYAKAYRSDGRIIDYRILSLIYDHRKVMDIDLRQNNGVFVNLEFYLLGYALLDNGTGSGYLSVLKASDFDKIELSVNNIKTSFASLTNMANDSRNVMSDQIVRKKDNVGTVPFRQMNVFSSDIYIKNFQNNTILKVVDIYRPAEIDYNLSTSQPVSNVKWFITAMPVDNDKKVGNGTLYYVQNPQIIEQ